MRLPLELRWLKAHNFSGFTPWHLIDTEDSTGIRREYQLETGKDFLPFARRQDNDDVAGFEVLNEVLTSKVLSVHLTWTGKPELDGYPVIKESENIFDWLKEVVIPATRDWMSEEDLEDAAKAQ